MNVLLVNGSPHEQGCTDTALQEAGRMLEQAGIRTTCFWIGSEPWLAAAGADIAPGQESVVTTTG